MVSGQVESPSGVWVSEREEGQVSRGFLLCLGQCVLFDVSVTPPQADDIDRDHRTGCRRLWLKEGRLSAALESRSAIP